MTVSISDVSAAWPEPILQELTIHQLTNCSLALPFGLTEAAIKRGKVTFNWGTLRSWIKPPVSLPPSPHDAIMLDLPLKALTPVFMAELRASKPQKKVALDESIPDLFSGGGAPTAPAAAPAQSGIAAPPAAPAVAPAVPAAPVARAAAPGLQAFNICTPGNKPTDTNYFSKVPAAAPEVPADEAAPPVKKGPSPGTAFLNRYATPNEIVSKAAALDGVDGALIALPDGLLVANHIPPTMNPDTIAAFLPQIFGRVSQCTKELRLGELNNLNFTVGNVPWKIFKVGAIYFAAFGRPGEPLPTAQLAGIAAELDRKVK